MIRTYAKGRRLEYKIRDKYRQQGYFVIRQAKSTFPDLICIGYNEIVFIECKFNGYISLQEQMKIEEIEKIMSKFQINSRFIVASDYDEREIWSITFQG
jgi:Holliday junction resolvase